MSWKVFLAFVVGLTLLPIGIVLLLIGDDIISGHWTKKRREENRWDGSCPLPACRDLAGQGQPMCNRDGRPPCDVLVAIRDGAYDQVYGDDDE